MAAKVLLPAVWTGSSSSGVPHVIQSSLLNWTSAKDLAPNAPRHSNVQHVYATSNSFTAITNDGRGQQFGGCVAWAEKDWHGGTLAALKLNSPKNTTNILKVFIVFFFFPNVQFVMFYRRRSSNFWYWFDVYSYSVILRKLWRKDNVLSIFFY